MCVCVCTYTYICTFVCTHKSYPPTHTQTGECDKFRKALHRQAETEGKNVFHMDELKQIASKLGIKGLDRVIESLNANQVLLVCAYTYALYMNVCICACLRKRIFRKVGLSHLIFQRQPNAALGAHMYVFVCMYMCMFVQMYTNVSIFPCFRKSIYCKLGSSHRHRQSQTSAAGMFVYVCVCACLCKRIYCKDRSICRV